MRTDSNGKIISYSKKDTFQTLISHGFDLLEEADNLKIDLTMKQFSLTEMLVLIQDMVDNDKEDLKNFINQVAGKIAKEKQKPANDKKSRQTKEGHR